MRIHKLSIIILLPAACSVYLFVLCIVTAVKISNIDDIAKAKHAVKLMEAKAAFVKDLSREHRAFTEEYGRKAKELAAEKELSKRLGSELKPGTAVKKEKAGRLRRP